jgi:hypothetical protein
MAKYFGHHHLQPIHSRAHRLGDKKNSADGISLLRLDQKHGKLLILIFLNEKNLLYLVFTVHNFTILSVE